MMLANFRKSAAREGRPLIFATMIVIAYLAGAGSTHCWIAAPFFGEAPR